MQDIDVDLDLGLDNAEITDVPAAPAPKKKGPAKTKKAGPAVKLTETTPEPEPKEVEAEEKVRIIIDEIAGMSNYETVGVNGKMYQIKRGVPVWVPKSVVSVLECAVMTQTEIRRHPVTGERDEITRNFSAIPWRRA